VPGSVPCNVEASFLIFSWTEAVVVSLAVDDSRTDFPSLDGSGFSRAESFTVRLFLAGCFRLKQWSMNLCNRWNCIGIYRSFVEYDLKLTNSPTVPAVAPLQKQAFLRVLQVDFPLAQRMSACLGYSFLHVAFFAASSIVSQLAPQSWSFPHLLRSWVWNLQKHRFPFSHT